jgi:hypothetical protein
MRSKLIWGATSFSAGELVNVSSILLILFVGLGTGWITVLISLARRSPLSGGMPGLSTFCPTKMEFVLTVPTVIIGSVRIETMMHQIGHPK